MMMKLLSALLLVLLSVVPARAADDFASRVDTSRLDTLAVQHAQTLKTFDSFSRQVIASITGRGSIDGLPASFSVLDMAFRPEAYIDRNLIKIKNVPLRQDLIQMESLTPAEKQRILEEGTISLSFMLRPDVQEALNRIASSAAFKNKAVNDVVNSATTLNALVMPSHGLVPVAMIPPAAANPDERNWKHFDEFATGPGAEYGDQADRIENAIAAGTALRSAWQARDAEKVNAQIAVLADSLPGINPQAYPPELKRQVEVTYNRLTRLTIPGAALYFVAFVCFLMGARAASGGLRLWGLRVFAIALLVHTLAIGIRWWLVSETHGNWFDGIPIKNQYESVLMSAWFGALVGFVLELWRGRGVFGAAAAFCGWMSLVAIFVTPYVTGREIGGEIGQVAGVLMSYWLYIHVTAVVASYALIAMSFLMGIWWLVYYYLNYSQVAHVPARQLSDDAAEAQIVASGGGAAALSMTQTLARMLFVPIQKTAEPAARATAKAKAAPKNDKTAFLATLDQCNLVVLQLAFWILGAGVILGAVWADQSWGRPWGWDPKETFALVTWIVYLIVVHVRFVTPDKAWWTALLSIVGFAVMLFNWIGVNFFMVGLHSYA